MLERSAISAAVVAVLTGFASSFLIVKNAQATCGLSQFPGCVTCGGGSNADWNHSGCISCPGWCKQFSSPEPKEKFESDSAKQASIAREIRGNHFDLNPNELNAIGQVNPMVALVLAEFLPSAESHVINIKQGRVAYRGIPTTATLQLKLQDSVDDAAYAATMKQVDAGTYAETKWSSDRTGSGDLVVTFDTSINGMDTIPQKAIMPRMAVVLTGSSPVKLVSWHVVE